MVGGRAAADAVARARGSPTLRVGLHLVLVCGRPVSPPGSVPDLVDAEGRFSSRLVRAGFAYFFRRRVKDQLRAEIRAQFARFRESGLELDHVNAHNHMHLHPTVLGLILEIGREFGVPAVRVPYEPFWASWRATRETPVARLASALSMWPLTTLMRRRLGRAGIFVNDRVFGLNDTGRLNRDRLGRLLSRLPDGVSEIYCHPATRHWPDMDPLMAHYQVEDELAALVDPEIVAMVRRGGIEQVAFRDLAISGGESATMGAPREPGSRGGRRA